MSTVWIVSMVLAWAVIALLVTCLVVVLRQVGELRASVDRLGPGATVADSDELELYDPVEPTELRRLDGGEPIPLGGAAQEEPLVLVVHAPGCESCEGIEEALVEIAGEGPPARLVSVLALREDAALGHVADHPLPGVPQVAWDSVPEALRPETTPGAVAVAAGGTVAAIGSPTLRDDLREAATIAANAVLVAGPDSMRVTRWGRAVPAWGAGDSLDVLHVPGTDHAR